jgi:hypothetical protein
MIESCKRKYAIRGARCEPNNTSFMISPADWVPGLMGIVGLGLILARTLRCFDMKGGL